jgi:hypothetical protein
MLSRNSVHHVIPRSRIRKGMVIEKEIELPKLFHASWHIVFDNLYDDEAVEFIRVVNKLMKIRESLTTHELNTLREQIKKHSFKGGDRKGH